MTKEGIGEDWIEREIMCIGLTKKYLKGTSDAHLPQVDMIL